MTIADLLDHMPSKSSLLEKLNDTRRRMLHQALIDRDPPTYRDVYNRFHLLNEGISFTAFYSYARKIRALAARLTAAAAPTFQVADHTDPEIQPEFNQKQPPSHASAPAAPPPTSDESTETRPIAAHAASAMAAANRRQPPCQATS